MAGTEWDYGEESPLVDARGWSMPRSAAHPSQLTDQLPGEGYNEHGERVHIVLLAEGRVLHDDAPGTQTRRAPDRAVRPDDDARLDRDVLADRGRRVDQRVGRDDRARVNASVGFAHVDRPPRQGHPSNGAVYEPIVIARLIRPARAA